MHDILTIKEVAKLLRVTPLTVSRWGKRIPHVVINGRGDRRYLLKDVKKFMEDNKC